MCFVPGDLGLSLPSLRVLILSHDDESVTDD